MNNKSTLADYLAENGIDVDRQENPGYWIIQRCLELPYRCSNCGCVSGRASRFCPDCGKEMKIK